MRLKILCMNSWRKNEVITFHSNPHFFRHLCNLKKFNIMKLLVPVFSITCTKYLDCLAQPIKEEHHHQAMMITPELLGLIPTSALNALNKSAGIISKHILSDRILMPFSSFRKRDARGGAGEDDETLDGRGHGAGA
jgi:hypothetical protein